MPPSQFQKRKGSIFATPGGRDGHVKGQERDKAFHDKVSKLWSMIRTPMLMYNRSRRRYEVPRQRIRMVIRAKRD